MNIFEATTKISKISEQKYGCPVEFCYFRNLAIDENAKFIFEIIERNFGAQFVISHNQILIPVYVDSELFGSIVVKESQKMDPVFFEEIHIFLDSTLRDFIIRKERLRRLRIEEAALNTASHSNVIPLFKNWHGLHESNHQDRLDDQDNERAALFLTGGDADQAREVAFDIHGFLRRNSFVPYSVLDLNSANFSESLPALGRITIFIPEILHLSQNEVLQIFTYLNSKPKASSPFLIISSQKNIEEIEVQELLEKSFAQILRTYHLEFKDPAHSKQLYKLLFQGSEELRQ